MSASEAQAQPHLFPADYFSAAERPAELPCWAVRTKPRAEKKLSMLCQDLGLGHYLPTTLRRHCYGNRAVRSHWVPVFAGYVFVMTAALPQVQLFRSNAVLQILTVPQPAELYSDLRHVWLSLAATPGAVEEARYQPGAQVEVVSGPLRGVVGVLEAAPKGKSRILITVRFFERALAVDIDVAHVRPL